MKSFSMKPFSVKSGGGQAGIVPPLSGHRWPAPGGVAAHWYVEQASKNGPSVTVPLRTEHSWEFNKLENPV